MKWWPFLAVAAGGAVVAGAALAMTGGPSKPPSPIPTPTPTPTPTPSTPSPSTSAPCVGTTLTPGQMPGISVSIATQAAVTFCAMGGSVASFVNNVGKSTPSPITVSSGSNWVGIRGEEAGQDTLIIDWIDGSGTAQKSVIPVTVS